jgi:hypothetical protein
VEFDIRAGRQTEFKSFDTIAAALPGATDNGGASQRLMED